MKGFSETFHENPNWPFIDDFDDDEENSNDDDNLSVYSPKQNNAQLYELIEQRDWNAAIQILEDNDDNNNNNNKLDMIHYRREDNNNFTPLHAACWKNAPLSLIQLLLDIGGMDILMLLDGDGDTPFHMSCKDSDKATINAILEISSSSGSSANEDILSVENGQGWTPFHYACGYRDVDVIKMLVDFGGVDIAKKPNKKGNISFHFACKYATTKVIRYMINLGGENMISYANTTGSTPFHFACGSNSVEVIQFLIKSGGREIINENNVKGSFPLHYACGFAHVDAIKYLLEESEEDILTATNSDGNTHLDILYRKVFSGAPGRGVTIENVHEAIEVIHSSSRWNDVDPSSIPLRTVRNSLSFIQNRSKSKKFDGYQSIYLQTLLNEMFIDQSYLTVLMVDLYVQIGIIVALSLGVHYSLTDQSNGSSTGIDSYIAIAVLGILCLWITLREVMQIITTPVRDYVAEAQNIFDVIQTIIVPWSIYELYRDNNTNYEVIIVTTGIVWLKLLHVLGNLFSPIAIFVIAVQQIVLSLIPFLTTTCITVAGFAHMYYIANASEVDCGNFEDSEGFCDLSSSYFTSFAMLLTSEFRFLGDSTQRLTSATILSWIFATVIGILLLNILIAEISNVFTYVREEGKEAFWANRFEYIAELHFINSQAGQIFNKFTGCIPRGEPQQKERGFVKDIVSKDEHRGDEFRISRINFSTVTYAEVRKEISINDKNKFFYWWFGIVPFSGARKDPSLISRLYYFFKWASIEEVIFPGPAFERVLAGRDKFEDEDSMLIYRLMTYLMFPLILIFLIVWFILGLVTLGYCWPKMMKEFFFFGSVSDTEDANDSNLELKEKLIKLEHQLDDMKESHESIQKLLLAHLKK